MPMNSWDFEDLAQPDDFALAVRHLDADRGLARDALDQDALGLERQAEVLGELGDAAVLDAGFGLELEGGDHRAGIDLRHLPMDVELGVLLGEHLRQQLEFVGVDRLSAHRRRCSRLLGGSL